MVTNYVTTLIHLYLYQYLLFWATSYIVVNRLISTFQRRFNCVNPFSCSWDISWQSFYSYWWPDISVICCHSCTSCIYADSPHLGLSSTTWFVKIGLLVVEIQAEWSLWQVLSFFSYFSLFYFEFSFLFLYFRLRQKKWCDITFNSHTSYKVWQRCNTCHKVVT